MLFWRRNRDKARPQQGEYATHEDFQKIFSENMPGLHLLASLLTADQETAEQVFVAGLEDSINGNPVFRQWARSWSQRAIIKRAIKAVLPSPSDERSLGKPIHGQTGRADLDALVEAVAQLNDFQRFVFVLSVLEDYSNTDCATLLACTVPDVINAKAAAISKVSAARRFESALAQNAAASWKSLFAVA